MQRFIAVSLVIILLAGCPPKTPFLLAEWNMTSNNLMDMAWSPDSKLFAINYSIKTNEQNSEDNFVQAFSTESLKSVWVAKDSQAWNLVFIPNESLIAETSTMSGRGTLYLREIKQGKIMRQLQASNCGGGWSAMENPSENTVLVADPNRFIGLNADNVAFIYQWDLKTGACKELLQYGGGFDIFDLNSEGNLLAYGGEGKDNSIVIWDIEKQTELCRTSEVDYGHFVPNQNILAVLRNQRIVFLDTSTCHELRELPISTKGTYFAFSPDGQRIAIATNAIYIIDASTGKSLLQIPFPQNISSFYHHKFSSGEIKFSPDGRYLLVAFGAKIQLWQVQ